MNTDRVRLRAREAPRADSQSDAFTGVVEQLAVFFGQPAVFLVRFTLPDLLQEHPELREKWVSFHIYEPCMNCPGVKTVVLNPLPTTLRLQCTTHVP